MTRSQGDATPLRWRDVAGIRGFRRLWLGDAVSLLGDWLTYVAVGTLALAEGSGLVAVALILVAHTLPRALLAPVAGRLADRHDRRAILVTACLARGAVVVAMAVAADAGRIGLVEGLLFLRMALGAFLEPAASAALPQLVPRRALAPANALLGATWSVVFALGVAVGGVVTAALGAVGALTIDAITFAVAAAILATLPRLRPSDPSDDGGASEARGEGQGSAGQGSAARGDDPIDRGRLADAWALAWRDRRILEAALARTPVTLVGGGAWVLLHALAGRVAPAEVALALGGLHSVRAIGSGVGPLLWARSSRLAATSLGLHASTLLALAAVTLLALARAPAALAGAALLWGIAGGASWVSAATRIQSLTPGRARGRIAAIDLLAHALGQCVGGLGGALLADRLGAPRAAAWFGVAGGGLAWLAVLALVHGARLRASRVGSIRGSR